MQEEILTLEVYSYRCFYISIVDWGWGGVEK